MITEAFALIIVQRALLAVLLASVACGIIGSLIVVRRMSSISGGLSHAAFGGVGLGYLFGIGPLPGAFGFSIICAIIIGLVYRREREHLDTLISMLWSVGMAVGMIALALSVAGAPDLTHYLFGSILFVPEPYLYALLGLDLLLFVILFFAKNELLAVAFDEEFAEIRGLPVGPLFLLLLCLIAAAVVMLMKVAGVILTISLLTTPAVIARQWSSRLFPMMTVASLIAAAMSVFGLFATYGLSVKTGVDIPTGPAIIVLGALFYLLSTVAVRVRGRSELR